MRIALPFRIKLQRPQHILSMQLNCGIVGLPNVGKSTLFNALVGSAVAQAANFPFCTIGNIHTDDSVLHSNSLVLDPNVGLVNVPDKRLPQLGVINHSVKVVPAVVSHCAYNPW